MLQSIQGDRRDIGQINRQLLGLIDKVFAVLMQVKTLNIFLMVQILFAVKVGINRINRHNVESFQRVCVETFGKLSA